MSNNYKYKTVHQAMYDRHKRCADTPAQLYKDEAGTFHPISYKEMWDKIAGLATSLRKLGVTEGSKVGIISDNRWEWLVANLAILSCRGCDVPRGSDSTHTEIAYILNHAECNFCFAENVEQCKKILKKKPETLKAFILFDTEGMDDFNAMGTKLYSFSALLEKGKKTPSYKKHFEDLLQEGTIDDVASIIYTSGTTGTPKGIILTHKNFLYQLSMLGEYHLVEKGDIMLCILPVWHSFERIGNYLGMYQRGTLAYSKPVASVLLKDMQEVRPAVMASVPRIWEGVRAGVLRNVSKESVVKRGLFAFFLWVGTCHAHLKNMLTGSLASFTRPRSRILDIILALIPFILFTPFKMLGSVLVFSKIKSRLGGRFKHGVSGGSALPSYVDTFFQAIGVSLIEGYGLTETSPVIAANHPDRTVRGTVGMPLKKTEWKIVDKEGKVAGPGVPGELHVRSDQVMRGYYKSEKETKRVLSKDGWLKTGDLALSSVNGAIKIIGRVKDTIVLRNGENVEPDPVEQAICQSPYIDYAMVVGQDQMSLAALIFPNMETIVEFAEAELPELKDDIEAIASHEKFTTLIQSEIKKFVNYAAGFRPFEQITRSRVVPVTLTMEKELSKTLKLMRFKLLKQYESIIKELYKK